MLKGHLSIKFQKCISISNFLIFQTHGSLLVEYIEVAKKLKRFGEHLIREKDF